MIPVAGRGDGQIGDRRARLERRLAGADREIERLALGVQRLPPADRAVGPEADGQQRGLARLEPPGERSRAAAVRPGQPVDRETAGLAGGERQPIAREAQGELLAEVGTRHRQLGQRRAAARRVEIERPPPLPGTALGLQPEPAVGELEAPPAEPAEGQGRLGAAGPERAPGVGPETRLQVRADPGPTGREVQPARDRELRGRGLERTGEPDRPAAVAEPDLPGGRQHLGEARELRGQRPDIHLGRAEPDVDPAALDLEGQLAPAIDRRHEIGEREMRGSEVEVALGAERSERDALGERQMTVQIEVGIQPAGRVDQLAARHLDGELGLGPAGAQLGRERQPELAPGRLELDLGRAQHHLVWPGRQAEAAAGAAGGRLEPGQLELAVDQAGAQLQAFGLDAGDPAAQEIAQAVTNPQVPEAITGRRAEAQAGELETARAETQIVEPDRLDPGRPETGAQQGPGKPEQRAREAGDQEDDDQQQGGERADHRRLSAGIDRGRVRWTDIAFMSISYIRILTDDSKFA